MNSPPPGIDLDAVDGGRHAVFRLVGPHEGIGPAYRRLFDDWLASSGEIVAQRPCMELYRNTPGRDGAGAPGHGPVRATAETAERARDENLKHRKAGRPARRPGARQSMNVVCIGAWSMSTSTSSSESRAKDSAMATSSHESHVPWSVPVACSMTVKLGG